MPVTRFYVYKSKKAAGFISCGLFRVVLLIFNANSILFLMAQADVRHPGNNLETYDTLQLSIEMIIHDDAS